VLAEVIRSFDWERLWLRFAFFQVPEASTIEFTNSPSLRIWPEPWITVEAANHATLKHLYNSKVDLQWTCCAWRRSITKSQARVLTSKELSIVSCYAACYEHMEGAGERHVYTDFINWNKVLSLALSTYESVSYNRQKLFDVSPLLQDVPDDQGAQSFRV